MKLFFWQRMVVIIPWDSWPAQNKPSVRRWLSQLLSGATECSDTPSMICCLSLRAYLPLLYHADGPERLTTPHIHSRHYSETLLSDVSYYWLWLPVSKTAWQICPASVAPIVSLFLFQSPCCFTWHLWNICTLDLVLGQNRDALLDTRRRQF